MDTQRPVISFRCIVLGVILMPMTCVFLILTEVLWGTTSPTSLSIFSHVVFVLFCLTVANLALKRWAPRWALHPGELLVIYTMLSLASALCSIDLLVILVSTLPYLHHFEPLEHKYAIFMKYVPESLLVTDPTSAGAYFLGQESIYNPAMYLPWIRPLAIWSIFVIALFAVFGGIILVFRRPWTQYEKLSYPMIQVPMILVNETESLFRNRLFWNGFLVVAFIDLLNGLNTFYPILPKIPVVHVVNIQSFFPSMPWAAMGWTWASFYPFAIGLCYFMPVDLAFSCWFFYFVFKFQRVAAAHFGVHGMPGFPYVEEQTNGGYYTLALLALWVSRRHLVRLGRLVLGMPGGAEHPDQPGERAEARLAIALIVLGLLYLVWFSWCLYGMNLWITLFFFGSYFMISLAITRIRAELGYLSHDLHAIGPNFQVTKFLGAATMAREYPRDVAMFGFYNFLTRAYRAHPMPHGLEALRIAERMRMSHMRYMFAMLVAVLVGIPVTYWAMLSVMYKYGASDITTFGEIFGREVWTRTSQLFTTPEPHLASPTYAIFVGLAFSMFLAVMRLNFPWWPFHPAGFAVSGSWSMEQLWMPFMVASTIKLLILRYGGAKIYRQSLPLVLGIILGDFVAGTLWSLYGVVTEQNVYHFWPY